MIAYNEIKVGQIYSIDKKTQEMVKNVNDLDYNIGKSVKIITTTNWGIFTVKDMETGFTFDADNKMLGKLLRDVETK